LAALLLAGAGCAEETRILTTSTAGQEQPGHERLSLVYYKGINEPGTTYWNHLLKDASRLLKGGFNVVALEPPVLITERAGGKPRVILQGAEVTVPGVVDDLHREGLAVFLAPTTAGPGFPESLEADDALLRKLTEDVLGWADVAEQRQAELFAPLSRCNLVLGNETCSGWLQEILPALRERFQGPLAAKVAADIEEAPTAGGQHDFELLDYRGYDYLVIDIHPWGHVYNEERFRSYVEEVLDRAEAVAARDGLKGVIVGDLRLPRNNNLDVKLETGTWLNEEQQAEVADMVMALALPRTSGFFFYGWTLSGYGAKGFPVEDILIRNFGGQPHGDDGGGTTTTGTAGEDPQDAAGGEGQPGTETTIVDSG